MISSSDTWKEDLSGVSTGSSEGFATWVLQGFAIESWPYKDKVEDEIRVRFQSVVEEMEDFVFLLAKTDIASQVTKTCGFRFRLDGLVLSCTIIFYDSLSDPEESDNRRGID